MSTFQFVSNSEERKALALPSIAVSAASDFLPQKQGLTTAAICRTTGSTDLSLAVYRSTTILAQLTMPSRWVGQGSFQTGVERTVEKEMWGKDAAQAE